MIAVHLLQVISWTQARRGWQQPYEAVERQPRLSHTATVGLRKQRKQVGCGGEDGREGSEGTRGRGDEGL